MMPGEGWPNWRADYSSEAILATEPLLLVRGDPTRDILQTRDIVGVWKGGVAADREGYRTELQKGKNQIQK